MSLNNSGSSRRRKSCPACHALLAPKSKFCDTCGLKLSEQEDVEHGDIENRIQRFKYWMTAHWSKVMFSIIIFAVIAFFLMVNTLVPKAHPIILDYGSTPFSNPLVIIPATHYGPWINQSIAKDDIYRFLEEETPLTVFITPKRVTNETVEQMLRNISNPDEEVIDLLKFIEINDNTNLIEIQSAGLLPLPSQAAYDLVERNMRRGKQSLALHTNISSMLIPDLSGNYDLVLAAENVKFQSIIVGSVPDANGPFHPQSPLGSSMNILVYPAVQSIPKKPGTYVYILPLTTTVQILESIQLADSSPLILSLKQAAEWQRKVESMTADLVTDFTQMESYLTIQNPIGDATLTITTPLILESVAMGNTSINSSKTLGQVYPEYLIQVPDNVTDVITISWGEP